MMKAGSRAVAASESGGIAGAFIYFLLLILVLQLQNQATSRLIPPVRMGR